MAAGVWCLLGFEPGVPREMQRVAGHWVTNWSLSRHCPDCSTALSWGDFVLPLNLDSPGGFLSKEEHLSIFLQCFASIRGEVVLSFVACCSHSVPL